MKRQVVDELCSPLCYLSSNRLLCYKSGKVLIFTNGQKDQEIVVFKSIKERIIGQSKLLSRFFRLGIRTAIAIDETTIVCSRSNKLYELDLNTGQMSLGYTCSERIRPLKFTKISGIKGFTDGIYFGAYQKNFHKKPVSIYRRVDQDNWEIVYTFRDGEINHIHNIVADPYRQCLWILTGDFDSAAAIWKVTDGFSTVERVVFGKQIWRACVAFAVPEGLLYATDSPFMQNHICLLRDTHLTEISTLSGSCIYGCKWNDKYVFSTAVEPDGYNETLLRLLFGWKRGVGIQDSYSRIYIGDLNDGFREVYKEKKDYWPFVFQFGTIKFPIGVNKSNTLYFQPVAVQNNDMKLILLEI